MSAVQEVYYPAAKKSLFYQYVNERTVKFNRGSEEVTREYESAERANRGVAMVMDDAAGRKSLARIVRES